MNDERILELIAGDPAGGLAVAIDQHGSQLLGRLHLIAADLRYGNAHVEDVWQQAFISLLDPIVRDGIREHGGEILPWLTRFGRWRLADHHRHDHPPVDPEIPAPEIGDEAPPSTDVLLLRRAWERLSPRDKLLLTWRYGESRRESEMADELNMTVGAMKKALHDARARLKREMEKEGPNEE